MSVASRAGSSVPASAVSASRSGLRLTLLNRAASYSDGPSTSALSPARTPRGRPDSCAASGLARYARSADAIRPGVAASSAADSGSAEQEARGQQRRVEDVRGGQGCAGRRRKALDDAVGDRQRLDRPPEAGADRAEDAVVHEELADRSSLARRGAGIGLDEDPARGEGGAVDRHGERRRAWSARCPGRSCMRSCAPCRTSRAARCRIRTR